MLEDELESIWGNKGYTHWSSWLSHNDYDYWKGTARSMSGVFGSNSSVSRVHELGRQLRAENNSHYAPTEIVKQTATLIEQHLIEALSSPFPYIREWGKLIAAEQNPSMKGIMVKKAADSLK